MAAKDRFKSVIHARFTVWKLVYRLSWSIADFTMTRRTFMESTGDDFTDSNLYQILMYITDQYNTNFHSS